MKKYESVLPGGRPCAPRQEAVSYWGQTRGGGSPSQHRQVKPDTALIQGRVADLHGKRDLNPSLTV